MRAALHPIACCLSAAALLLAGGSAGAAAGDQPVAPLPAAKAGDDKARVRTASLPARGLFVGEQLSESARAQLAELIVEAVGLRVEVALLVPTGPWQIDAAGRNERDLTPARLAAVRRFLTERGVDARRIFVESRTDAKLTQPRLDVQMVGEPAPD